MCFTLFATSNNAAFALTERKKDPSFGMANVESEFDEKADSLIRAAVSVGTLNIFSNVDDMQYYLVFCCSRYGGMRGGKEIYNSKWNQFELGTVKDGPCKGLRFVVVSFPDGTKSKLFCFYCFILFYFI